MLIFQNSPRTICVTLSSCVMLSSWGHEELLCYSQLLGHNEILGHIELLGLTNKELINELIKTKETPVKTYLITMIGPVLIYKYNLKHFIVHMEVFCYRVCHK